MGDIAGACGGAVSTDRDDAATGYTPIPTGWYPAMVKAAEVKQTKAGTGSYLEVELEILGDRFAGRRIWARITLSNPSSKATDIGLRQLATLGQACGYASISDSKELLGKTIEMRVKVTPPRDGYDAGNDVAAYRKLGSGGQQAPARPASPTTSQPAPAAPAAPAAKRPWEK